MSALVALASDGGVATVTLSRPEKRNALSIELREELAAVLTAAAADEEVGCIVLTGAGSAFCAGMDVTQFGGDRDNRERLLSSSAAAFGALARCPAPVVAAINGPAIAGGFALALLCDLRIAAAGATMGFPELGRHIPPSYAAARSALAAPVARELCLTGRLLDARQALALGVVGEVADDAELPERAHALAAEIAAAPRAATRAVKRRVIAEGERSWLALLDDELEELRAALFG
jgi:enoyl-CoA hydratase